MNRDWNLFPPRLASSRFALFLLSLSHDDDDDNNNDHGVNWLLDAWNGPLSCMEACMYHLNRVCQQLLRSHHCVAEIRQKIADPFAHVQKMNKIQLLQAEDFHHFIIMRNHYWKVASTCDFTFSSDSSMHISSRCTLRCVCSSKVGTLCSVWKQEYSMSISRDAV